MQMSFEEYAEELAKSPTVRNAAFELIRLWRMGWDTPGSSGYTSYMLAYRRLLDLLPEHRGSFVELSQAILRVPREGM